MIGAAIGATLAFLTARYLVRQLRRGLLDRHPRLPLIDRAVERHGFRLVSLLRLSPAVPFILLNYVLGISRVRLSDYVGGQHRHAAGGRDVRVRGQGGRRSRHAGQRRRPQPRGALYYALIGLGLVVDGGRHAVFVTRIAATGDRARARRRPVAHGTVTISLIRTRTLSAAPQLQTAPDAHGNTSPLRRRRP